MIILNLKKNVERTPVILIEKGEKRPRLDDFYKTCKLQICVKITKIVILIFQQNSDYDRYSQKVEKLANIELLK